MKTEEAAEPSIVIHHTGQGYGPMETVSGRLNPLHSITVPKKTADRLCAAYLHIKRAQDVVGAGAVGGALSPGEKAKSASELKSAKAEADKARADHREALVALEAEQVITAGLKEEISQAHASISDLAKLKDEANERANAAEDKVKAAGVANADLHDKLVKADKARGDAPSVEHVAALESALSDFAAAKDKKGLEAAQEKHSELLK